MVQDLYRGSEVKSFEPPDLQKAYIYHNNWTYGFYYSVNQSAMENEGT